MTVPAGEDYCCFIGDRRFIEHQEKYKDGGGYHCKQTAEILCHVKGGSMEYDAKMRIVCLDYRHGRKGMTDNSTVRSRK